MTGLSTIKQTTLFVGGILGFSFYGFNFMVISLFFFIFLCVVDTLYGYSLARAKLLVSSKSWDIGMYRKTTQTLMIMGLMVLMGALAKEIDNKSIQMISSGIIIALTYGFAFGQITSIIENMAVGSHGKELWFINILLRVAGIGQAKIEEKIKKYESSTPIV